MSAYTGYLIRKTRMEKNLSQEGLAKGICASSYLSKIEKGTAEPESEIIDRLFAALGIEFVRDPALEDEAQRQLDRFFFLYEAQQPHDEQDAFFAQNGGRLERSGFALAYHVQRLCTAADRGQVEAAQALRARIEPFLPCMEEKLRQRALCAMADVADTTLESLELFKRAALLGPSCVVEMGLALCMNRMGQYEQSMETCERAFSLACEQGNPYVMIYSSFLMGTNACDRYDLGLAQRYYSKAIALSRGYAKSYEDYASYNLGATYLEIGREEEAFAWMKKTHEMDDDPHHNMMLHQKLTILYAGRGETQCAAEHLAQARVWLQEAKKVTGYGAALYEKMIDFAGMLIGPQAKRSPEYERLLLELYEQTANTFSHSFSQFYGRYLIEHYKSQRRYKDALRVREEIDRLS